MIYQILWIAFSHRASIFGISYITSQDVANSYDERMLLGEIAQSLAEAIAKELDPDGLNPSLANDIKAELDSEPSFYYKLSKMLFDEDDTASQDDVEESLSVAAANATAAVIPDAVKQVIQDAATKIRAASALLPPFSIKDKTAILWGV